MSLSWPLFGIPMWILVGLLVVVNVFVGIIVVQAIPPQDEEEKLYVYPVKFMCVPQVGFDLTLGEFLGPRAFEHIWYSSAINIYNQNSEPVEFKKIAYLAKTESEREGVIEETLKEVREKPTSVTMTESLSSQDAMVVDCVDIMRLFGMPPEPPMNLANTSGDGFLVIETSEKLTVVATYTSINVVTGSDVHGDFPPSIDVEYVKPQAITP